MDNEEPSSSKQIWQVDIEQAPLQGFEADGWGEDSMSMFINEPFSRPASSSSSAAQPFLFGQEEEDEEDEAAVPAGIESIMNQAIADQTGKSFDDYSQLLYQNDDDEEEGDEDTGFGGAQGSRDEEADMMDLDAEIGFQEDPKLFKDIPNYNKNSSATRRLKRSKKRKGIVRAYPALPDHIGEMMQSANMMYIEGKNSSAIAILRDVIKERADAHEAWLTLGMIYNSEGNVHKMIQCNMMAAHLSKANSDLWKHLAYSSKDLGYDDQAIYCFKKANRVDPKDLDTLYEMSSLMNDKGMTRQAEVGFEKILTASLLHAEAIKGLAKIYLHRGDPQSAIELFERLVRADLLNPLPPVEEGNDDEEEDGDDYNDESRIIYPQRMGYEELNMMSELCMDTLQTLKALELLHNGICRIQGQDSAALSYLSKTDYDTVLKNVPVELRVKIGLCCLHLENGYAADIHLRSLFELPDAVTIYPELFLDIGEMYMKKNQTQSAIKVFKSIEDVQTANNIQIERNIAECYLTIGDLPNALKAYEKVLVLVPNDVELQNQIVQILEDMGDDRKAARMQRKFLIDREREETSAANTRPGSPTENDKDNTSNSNLFSIKTGPKRISKKTLEERDKKKLEAMRIADENQASLKRMKVIVNQLDRKTAKAEYISLGKKMIASFSKGDRLRNKYTAESGIYGLKRIVAYDVGSGFDVPTVIDEKYDSMMHQGVSLREWLDFIIQYSCIAAKDCRFDDAHYALKAGLECNTFYADARRRLELQFILVGISFNNCEFELVSQIVRGYAFTGPFMITGLKLFCAALVGGPRAFNNFSASNNQKFMHRQFEKTLKMLEEDPDCLPPTAIAVLCATYGHVLFCAKSYGMAIDKYLFARSYMPKDPVINFSLGISFLHRATQKTESRHANILKVFNKLISHSSVNMKKAFAFLLEYRRIKGRDAESNYNMGRAFHQIQLFHMAIPFYEAVLADPSKKFTREASYNLANLYVSIDSPHLAKRLLQTHWVVVKKHQ